MASTSLESVSAKRKRPSGGQDRKLFAAAVLSGIYAAVGKQILDLENHEYTEALEQARKVAFDQADEMLKGRK